MLRARAPLIFVIAAVGIIAALVAAFMQQRVYQSQAVIQVQSPMITDTDTARESMARRLQQIEQRITARDTMLDFANRYALFPRLASSDRVTAMRESIDLIGIASPQEGFGSDGAISSMIVMARTDSAQGAAELANEIAARIMELGTEARSSRVAESLEFFRAEETRLTAELTAIEDELEAFRIDNVDRLPASLESRVGELFEREGTLRALRRDIAEMESDIAALHAGPQSVIVQRRLRGLEDSLSELRAEEERIADAVAELDPIVRAMPEVERQLATLERRRDQLRDQLLATSQRRSETELTARLEADQRAERFDLIESATVPDHPISRGRRSVAMMGAIAALGMAFLTAFALELFRPVLRTPGQVERALGMRPVLSVPDIRSAAVRRRTALGWVAGMGLAALSMLAVLLHFRSS